MIKKYNFVYKTINLLNGIFYLGVHSTDDLNDGYLGSGLILRKAIKKHGINNFKREIIKFFDTRKEAYDYENKIVTPKLIKSRKCYNRAIGGRGGCLGDKAIAKMRKTKMGCTPWNKGLGKKVVCIKCSTLLKNTKAKFCRKCYTKYKTKGKSNPVWKGYYGTPQGRFETALQASLVNKIPPTTLKRYCKLCKKGYSFIPIDPPSSKS
jgi:ribosomal protein L40E